jgi:hypothetical protein
MSNLYRGSTIDASYQVWVHLAKRFQRRRFKKIGQSETRMAYGHRTSEKCQMTFSHTLSKSDVDEGK